MKSTLSQLRFCLVAVVVLSVFIYFMPKYSGWDTIICFAIVLDVMAITVLPILCINYKSEKDSTDIQPKTKVVTKVISQPNTPEEDRRRRICSTEGKPVKTLVIVARAAGEIGSTFVRSIITRNIDCIAVIRHKELTINSPLLTQLRCNLEDDADIRRAFQPYMDQHYNKYQRIVYLHSIGIDHFETRGYPNIRPLATIPSEVYATNVNTFKYLLKYLFDLTEERQGRLSGRLVRLKVAIIAGIADKYSPFVIESYCEAKMINRQYIQSAILQRPCETSGLSINISSTKVASALRIRPHADTSYWLEPEEVVTRSIDILLSEQQGYQEIDIFKNMPSFVGDYYWNNRLLYEKWSKETGIYSEDDK